MKANPYTTQLSRATAVLHRALRRIAVRVAYCQMSRGDDHADEVAVQTEVAS